jgi:hypothetical protein
MMKSELCYAAAAIGRLRNERKDECAQVIAGNCGVDQWLTTSVGARKKGRAGCLAGAIDVPGAWCFGMHGLGGLPPLAGVLPKDIAALPDRQGLSGAVNPVCSRLLPLFRICAPADYPRLVIS